MMRRFVLLSALALLTSLVAASAEACPDRDSCGMTHAGHFAADDPGAVTEVDTEAEDTGAWDVNEPREPYSEMQFTVDEGTWMSVDVSPAGDRIVFDLLGDLYVLPIGGGKATRLTHGLAWDYQPRFSPDGTEILFTSDRGGGNNLWTLALDEEGAEPEALSDTGEKDTNCGAWSPDGEWIASKRRFTDSSSIGTTELWMFHRRGGDGIQITKKGEIPEVSEPIFHPEGRFLYFSARPRRFTYDQNPYQGIYQIRRFDRLTGEIANVTSRFGGASRPSISPDGRILSFISRDGIETVLVLHDLRSGAERILLRGLNHDLQESFAWAGTYPGMDFTPDGESIVLWMGGKIVRVDVASGAVEEIPFECDVHLFAQDAVRPTPDVSSDTFDVRLMRWMHTSPKDQTLVFSALGRLYVAGADGSDPHVLLKNDDDSVFEYAPRFSPDGKSIAFVTWSDVEKGQVWVVGADGRNPRQISDLAGQWVNPTWSADGTEILAIRGSGATLRGSTLGDEMHHELFILPAKGGEAQFVTTLGARGSAARMPMPQFDGDASRIYFLRDGGQNTAEFVSVRRDGTDRRTHVKVKYGDEFAISPDERWVAYKRLHDAYLAPMPAPGTGPLDLGDSDGAVKVVSLTDGMADWITWENAETLTWTTANELYRTTVADVFAKIDAEAERAKEKDEAAETDAAADGEAASTDASAEDAAVEPGPFDPTKVEVRLTVPRAKPEGTLALIGARLITMNGDEVIDRGTVVIEGNRIVAVGGVDEVSVPDGAEVVDVSGTTIMPGLVDAHAHMGYNSMDVLPQRDWQYYANLAYGVTATMDPSASTHLVFAQSEMVEAGVMKGPRVYSTGFILYGADIPGRAPTKSYEDALRHVRRMKKYGAFAIKSYMQPKRIQRQWYVKACRELEMLNFPEGGGNFEGNMGMILDGHTGIEHTTPVAPLYEDVLTMWSRTEVGYTPTFLVAYGGISGEHWFYLNEGPVWADEKLTRFTPRGVIESRSRRLNVVGYEGDYFHMTVAESANELLKRGVYVNLGAHGQRQGLGCHWDLWALAQGGTSNHDVLRAGTINPARYIGLGDELGSIEVGKLADLVVLRADPLENIRNTNTVRYTIKNGELFDADSMDELWPREIAREPFLWETGGETVGAQR